MLKPKVTSVSAVENPHSDPSNNKELETSDKDPSEQTSPVSSCASSDVSGGSRDSRDKDGNLKLLGNMLQDALKLKPHSQVDNTSAGKVHGRTSLVRFGVKNTSFLCHNALNCFQVLLHNFYTLYLQAFVFD